MKNRLKELREESNLRQIDVSNATKIDQKTLSNYETGKTNPDSFALVKLADFYNASIDYILYRIDFKSVDNESINAELVKIIKKLNDIIKVNSLQYNYPLNLGGNFF